MQKADNEEQLLVMTSFNTVTLDMLISHVVKKTLIMFGNWSKSVCTCIIKFNNANRKYFLLIQLWNNRIMFFLEKQITFDILIK